MIIIRTPLRISLAGGGTDLPRYYQTGQGAVCSIAIDKYIYITINNLSHFFPHRYRIAYSKTELIQSFDEIHHPIVRESLRHLNLKSGGIDISVMADIPAGTGLGSSSAFTVGLMHGLFSFQGKISSKELIAKEASNLEINILKEPIGKQDHYASAFGGINLIHFFKDEEVRVDPLPLSEEKRNTLLKNMMLFYLGGTRSASQILKKQNSSIHENIDTLNKMRDQAIRLSQVLTENKNLDEAGEILRKGWELKKTLSENISNSEVDQKIETSIRAGAIGGKLLGAGGSGFLLLYVPEKHQKAVAKALPEHNPIPFKVDTLGSSLLYYS